MNRPESEASAQVDEGLVEDLQGRIGSSGKVQDFYGGIRILVLDPSAFPWALVLDKLADLHEEIWVRKHKQGIEIISKPPAP